MNISPARLAAFEILTKIETDKAFSSILLANFEQSLSLKDRALCHEITLGVLRRQLYLDRIIEKLTNGRKLDTAVKITLRIGLYQILFLDKIPAYSAINESVNLVNKARKTSAKGLVNAILRRSTREKIALKFSDEIEKVSVETSHPRWLIEKWIEQFGFEETEKLARANNEISRIAFRPTAKISPEGLEMISKFEKSVFLENCFIAKRFNADLLRLAGNSEIYVQDEASQIVAGSVELEDGQLFLDVCAAPGSKTTQISNFKLNISNLLVAGDIHWNRVKILQENCRRQTADFVNIVQYDAVESLPFADESFDCVLLDAPCSGTGTIRHNPEIRYFLQKNDFEELSGKQLKLLENASKLVKPGGNLIYSTCSLEREENEKVIERFLIENSEFNKSVPHVPEKILTPENFGRTFPQTDNSDGFFIAMMKRERFFHQNN